MSKPKLPDELWMVVAENGQAIQANYNALYAFPSQYSACQTVAYFHESHPERSGHKSVLAGVHPDWRDFGRAILEASKLHDEYPMALAIDEIIKRFEALSLEAR